MSANGRKPYELNRKQKKTRERGMKENQDKMQMNLSTPTHKNMWKHGKPKDKRRSNGGKRRRLHWWLSNKWPKSDAQTWKQKKTKYEELIGNSRPSLKKSPCDKDSQELICVCFLDSI